MKKLFPKDVVNKIEGKINKNGIEGIDIKDLIVYVSAFFNDQSGAMEERIKGLKDTLDKSFTEYKMLKWTRWAIVIPLWGLFLHSIFFK